MLRGRKAYHSVAGTVEKQQQLEELNKKEAVTKYVADINKAIKEGRITETPYGLLLVKLGYLPFRDKLQEYLNSTLPTKHYKIRNLLLLISVDVDVIAYEVLTSILSELTSKKTPTLLRLSSAIMKRLFNNYIYSKIKEDNPKLYTYLGYEFKRASKRRKEELIQQNIKALHNTFTPPDSAISVQLGSVLIDLLDRSGANILSINLIRTNGIKTTRHFSLSEEALEAIASVDGESMALRIVERLPMLVPPTSWTSIHKGGYLSFSDRLLSSGHSNNIHTFQEEGDYSKVLPIINKLQRIAWRVNTRMLELIEYVFTNDIPLGTLPTNSPKVWQDYMAMPEYDEANKSIWSKANRRRQQIKIDLDKEFSKRFTLTLNLGTARKMSIYKQFYYSYRLDYRGRVYPTSTWLNLQNKKEVKSLLEFSTGEYLTQEGIRWLKIHIANVYGIDKAVFDVRVRWVEDNYTTIMKIGEDPLSNLSLVSEADSPFEYVAGCMAYRDMVLGEKVHLPIQLDAINSGIQMYSGLLRDKEGAKETGVINKYNKSGEVIRPDLYTVVAKEVERKFKEGEYDPILSYTDSEGVKHSILTKEIVDSIAGEYEIVEVVDDYKLKAGEMWYEEN